MTRIYLGKDRDTPRISQLLFSHACSSTLLLLHNTLTTRKIFDLSWRIWKSTFATDFSLYVKSSFISILWGYSKCEGSEIYFLSIETWDTGYTCDISGGKANRYAIMSISPVSQKFQCILVLTFPFCLTSSHLSSVTPSETQVTKPKFYIFP